MSADNWTTCPRCLDRARAAADEQKQAVMGMYGSVPPEEFIAARDALRDPDPQEFCTFREDYEFYGASEGTVKADYSGSCTNCHLSVEFDAYKEFWPDEEDR